MNIVRILFSPLLDRAHIFTFSLLLVAVGLGATTYTAPTVRQQSPTQKTQIQTTPSRGSAAQFQSHTSNSYSSTRGNPLQGSYEGQAATSAPQQTTASSPISTMAVRDPASDSATPSSACTADSCTPAQPTSSPPLLQPVVRATIPLPSGPTKCVPHPA